MTETNSISDYYDACAIDDAECPDCGGVMSFLEWKRGVCYVCNDSPAVDD